MTKGPVTAPADLRRWAFIHEAGHAVVAFELGLTVESVECNGEEGGCRLGFKERAAAKLDQLDHLRRANGIDAHAYAQRALAIFEPWLAALLGGMIAEGSFGADAATATRRGGADLPDFFGIVRQIVSGLSTDEADNMSFAIYQDAHLRASREVLKSADQISAVADALESGGVLNSRELELILR